MANFRDNKFSRGRGGFRGGGGRGFRNRDPQGPVTMHQAVCDNCGKNCEVPFRPTSGKPVFCSSCFENKGTSDSRRFEERRMFDAVCNECGNNCKVPFQPYGDKPIYCSNCFENKDSSNVSRNSTPSQPQYEKQFKELNDKMDKILGLLTPVEKVPKKTQKSEKVASEQPVT